jgi:hypothetical protein
MVKTISRKLHLYTLLQHTPLRSHSLLLSVMHSEFFSKFQALGLHTFLDFLGILDPNTFVSLEFPSREFLCKHLVDFISFMYFNVLRSSRDRPFVSGRKKMSQINMIRFEGPQIQPILGPQPRCCGLKKYGVVNVVSQANRNVMPIERPRVFDRRRFDGISPAVTHAIGPIA